MKCKILLMQLSRNHNLLALQFIPAVVAKMIVHFVHYCPHLHISRTAWKWQRSSNINKTGPILFLNVQSDTTVTLLWSVLFLRGLKVNFSFCLLFCGRWQTTRLPVKTRRAVMKMGRTMGLLLLVTFLASCKFPVGISSLLLWLCSDYITYLGCTIECTFS